MVAIGRVVEVRGGGGGGRVRKDRHSKVYTSKGPKDRRVRLSAVTAIQFYDVQDRLGYERPSEAVDWLMHKAKASIEALPVRPRLSPYSLGVSSCFPSFEPQDLGIGAKDPTETGFKEEFSEAAKVGCHEKLQNLHHLGADSINFLPSYHIDSTLSSLSNEYVCMEDFINYGFENNYADPSLMLEEESFLGLPPSSRPGNHMQVCSLSKLFQSRELNSKMDAPIWRVDSTQEPVCDLDCEECNKH